jgi:DNA-3-methyladenine glycosylase
MGPFRLPRDFFSRHTVEVAQDLLGKKLVYGDQEGIITETEAYRGSDDEASHASRGITPRTSLMFGEPGRAYIYFIYGMYYCLNIVTEEPPSPGAVLIRSAQFPHKHIQGPGRLCKHLGLTKDQNGVDLLTSPTFYVLSQGEPVSYEATPRIGIQKAKDKLWRFVLNP